MADIAAPTRREHWDRAYATKAETDVSWYQARPEQSLALIRSVSAGVSSSLIDVGSGASTLTDALLTGGYVDLTALDISEAALGRARERLGSRAAAIAWIVADVTRWQPPRTWDAWHDRAVFHFLTGTAEQDAYLAALHNATHAGSVVVISCFAPDGPERCSGLPVQRYSPAALAQRIGSAFSLEAEASELHRTPWGSQQSFVYAALRRR